jgi:HK97 family phage portal protein
LWAAGLAAQTGHNIGAHAASFFAAMARPSGILTAPGHIGDDAAARLKEAFDGFRGSGAGAVAVAGDGLKFEPLLITSTDAQLLEVLKLSAVQVAQVFRVPPFMIGAEPAPSVANSELDLAPLSCRDHSARERSWRWRNQSLQSVTRRSSRHSWCACTGPADR